MEHGHNASPQVHAVAIRAQDAFGVTQRHLAYMLGVIPQGWQMHGPPSVPRNRAQRIAYSTETVCITSIVVSRGNGCSYPFDVDIPGALFRRYACRLHR